MPSPRGPNVWNDVNPYGLMRDADEMADAWLTAQVAGDEDMMEDAEAALRRDYGLDPATFVEARRPAWERRHAERVDRARKRGEAEARAVLDILLRRAEERAAGA